MPYFQWFLPDRGYKSGNTINEIDKLIRNPPSSISTGKRMKISMTITNWKVKLMLLDCTILNDYTT